MVTVTTNGVTVLDSARRCSRCRRVTVGTRMVGLAVQGDEGFVLQVRLCTTCRCKVTDTVRETLEQAG